MPSAIEDALNSLAQDIDLRVDPTASPYIFDLGLLTPVSPSDLPLTVGFSREVTEVIEHQVDLLWVSRDVRFAEAQLPIPPASIDLTNLGPLPILPSSPTDPIAPGVPGSVGRISGKFPVAVSSLEAINEPVTIDLRVSVLDDNHQPLASSESFGWKIGNDLGGEGGVIVPPPDRVTDAIKLTLIPPFVDFTGTDILVGRWIEARFRLKASGTSTAWFDLRKRVVVPALQIPTLAFLFKGLQQQPPALLVMPTHSPLGPDTFLDTLDKVGTVLDQLRSVLAFLGMFIDLVDDLRQQLDGAQISVVKADQLPHLNDIDLIHYPNWPNLFNVVRNDIEVEDEVSSLLFFGPPGRRLEAYNATNFSNSQGELHVTVGRELVVRINTLHSPTPGSVPGNLVSVPKAPTGCRGAFCFASFAGGGHKITTFGDELSSLRLAGAT